MFVLVHYVVVVMMELCWDRYEVDKGFEIFIGLHGEIIL